MGFRAYDSNGVDKHRAKCNMGFGSGTQERGRFRPISTSANFDFGQFRLRPIFGCWFLGPRWVGPRRVGPRRVGPRRVGGPKISLFFFPLPPPFRSFCVSLGVFSWKIGGVLKRRGLKCARLEFSGCRVKPGGLRVPCPRPIATVRDELPLPTPAMKVRGIQPLPDVPQRRGLRQSGKKGAEHAGRPQCVHKRQLDQRVWRAMWRRKPKPRRTEDPGLEGPSPSADRVPQQFGGSRLDYCDFAFRMEGYAAVLSRDGQGGALLRDVAKLEKFEDNTIEISERSFWMSNN